MEVKVDLMKLKKVISEILTSPRNKDGNHNFQIGDILIDIEEMEKSGELKNIYVFKSGSETEQWRIDFRRKDTPSQIQMIFFPYDWVKGIEKEKEKEVI